MWVRGLKPMCFCVHLYKTQSHPMWVRGLKLTDNPILLYEKIVAPYVGAWIETSLNTPS